MKKARVRVQSVDNSVIVKFLSQMYMRKLASQAGGGSGAALPPALQARVQKWTIMAVTKLWVPLKCETNKAILAVFYFVPVRSS